MKPREEWTERAIRAHDELKVCFVCKERKPRTTEFFHKQGRGLDSTCRTCRNIRKPDPTPDGTQRCITCKTIKPATVSHFYLDRQSGKVRGQCKQCAYQARKTWILDPENAEKTRAAHRAWDRRNPLAARVKRHKRRAAIAGSAAHHTPADILAKLADQKGLCYWCNKKLETTGHWKYQVDHIIPLSRGGSNGPDNICCACRSCNASKCDKTPWDFAGRLF